MKKKHISLRLRKVFCLSILIFSLFLAPPPVSAGFWGNDSQEITLDNVVSRLCENLADQVNLRREPVLISSNDFFDAHSGLSLPLATQLRGKFITEMKKQGARVLLPGCDEDQYLILQGTWQKEGEFLALDIKIMKLVAAGPEAVAAASRKISLKKIDDQALVADLDSWGRYLVRKLEGKVRDRKQHSVYLRKFRPKGELLSQPDLALYLDDWIRPAFAESNLFRILDPQHELKYLNVEQLRTRGLRQNRGIKPELKNENDLTADLLRSDTELWGSAWHNRDKLEIRASILDASGRQVTAATVAIPDTLFPNYLIKTNAPKKIEAESISMPEGHISKGGLKVEISTNRGDNLPQYRQGEQIRFLVRINRNAWIYIFYLNPDNSTTLLYPLDNQNQPDTGSQQLKANRLLILPDDGCPYDLKVSEPFGKDKVMAIASEKRLPLPNLESQLWQQANKLFDNLRNQMLRKNCGYAETKIELITKAR
ncbi:MAG: hypothetical protein DRH03_11895 [Deltaproteobacteria bacterium]|nr:MAG: hypothetical protein DRH03_11895 [Deltaproteobacteria bacterium]